MPIFNRIESFINELDIQTISAKRREVLEVLIDSIQQQIDSKLTIRLNFICTHNSRRSHFTQIWAQTIANYFNIDAACYSGGTQATALFPKVIETLEKTGFEVEKLSNETNPVYAIKFDENEQPIIGFSKEIDHVFNPSSAFTAIMTCWQAAEDCPFIFGADQRISLPYKDPKAFDDTEIQGDKYLETSMIIATELHYVFSQIKKSHAY
ncbi:MAG: arsenate reductase [Vicingaceae bacterium]